MSAKVGIREGAVSAFVFGAVLFALVSFDPRVKAQVTDSLLDRCKPIAGTPADCIRAIEEDQESGCSHVMLELWGANRLDQIRLFAEEVLPHVRP